MKLKMVFGLGLFLISFSVFADTYSVIINYSIMGFSGTTYTGTNANQVCDSWAKDPFWSDASTRVGTYLNGSCSSRSAQGDFLTAANPNISYSCPGGGTVSDINCINAPACVSPQVRNATTGMCEAPACAPPNFVNSFGICEIPECVTYKVPNALTGVCQIPPTCGFTEYYDNPTNTCKISALNCPGHSHANAANDACLPDPKNACPAGQHDDGTYTCVADDPTVCMSPKQYGFIDGVSQCITPSGITAEESAAIQAANDARAAADAADTANTACHDATVWWNDNPSNEARRIDMSQKCSYAQSLSNQAAGSASRSEVAHTKESNIHLKEINNTIQDKTIRDEKREEGKQAEAGGDNCDKPPACTGDAIQCEILKQSHKNTCRSLEDPTLSDKEVGGSVDKIAGVFGSGIVSDMGTGAFSGQQYVSTGFFNLGSSDCQTVPMSYKMLQYTFNPCDQLEVFRNLLGWFFYMYTAFSIVQLARDTK